mgnify:CR=1 FL=1
MIGLNLAGNDDPQEIAVLDDKWLKDGQQTD